MKVIRGKNNHPTELFPHRGVGLSVRYSYPSITHVTFTISVITTKLWESNYSEYHLKLDIENMFEQIIVIYNLMRYNCKSF